MSFLYDPRNDHSHHHPPCPIVLLSLFIQPLFYYTLHSIPFSSDKCTAPIKICLQMTKHPKNYLFIYQKKNVTINPSIMFCYDTLSYVRNLVSCMNSLMPLTVHKDGRRFRFRNAKVAKTCNSIVWPAETATINTPPMSVLSDLV